MTTQIFPTLKNFSLHIAEGSFFSFFFKRDVGVGMDLYFLFMEKYFLCKRTVCVHSFVTFSLKCIFIRCLFNVFLNMDIELIPRRLLLQPTAWRANSGQPGELQPCRFSILQSIDHLDHISQNVKIKKISKRKKNKLKETR